MKIRYNKKKYISEEPSMQILNGLLFDGFTFTKKDLFFENERITALHTGSDTLDVSGCYVIPGMIDIHTHGCSGFDFIDADANGLKKMDQWYLQNGVTSVAATLITAQRDTMLGALAEISAYTTKNPDSAICACRAEGPFLSPSRAGAHDIHLLSLPDIEFAEQMLSASGGLLRILDIDPCLDGAETLIRHFVNRLHLSLAHTPCTQEEALKAHAAGANGITHMFNAMAPVHHRAPAMLGAFTESSLTAELICDGIHVYPSLLKLLFLCDPERVCIISDSMAGCGMADGVYTLGGARITVKEGRAFNTEGTLAGSVCSVPQGLSMLVNEGIRLEKAAASATRIPAKLLGREDIGNLHTGSYADIVILSPKLTPIHVIKRGKLLF